MKKSKIVLCTLMAVMLLVGMIPLSASAEAWDGTTADTSWYNATDTEFTISTPEALAGFAAIVNGTATGIEQDTFAGKTVKLGADIDLGGKEWTPIAAIEYSLTPVGVFSGTFDGGNYSIKNLYMNTATLHTGLFGYVVGATIKNVSLVGANVTVLNNIANALLVVYAADSNIIGCSADATSSIICPLEYDPNEDALQVTAGLVAYILCENADCYIKDCVNNATVTATDVLIVAGVVAQAEGRVAIQNCTNNGAISGYDGVGGITGQSTPTEITGCVNNGSVTGTSSMVGGIIGCNDGSDCALTKCYNTGAVTGTYQVGGIVGNFFGGKIEYCYNTGTVTSTETDTEREEFSTAGGIVGSIISRSLVSTLSSCYNTGTVTNPALSAYVGSIVGLNENSAVSLCAVLDGTTAIGTGELSTGTAENIGTYTAEQFASGEVAYALNGLVSEGTLGWYQTIGTDAAPALSGGTVYKHTASKCAPFTNTADGAHTDADGDTNCELCGRLITYTVTFNANYTSSTSTKAETAEAFKLASLPIPAREGYIFEGWYDAPTGGNRVDESTVFSDDTTVYARWSTYIVSLEKTSTDGLTDTYTVTYSDGTTATFNVTNGKDGDKGDKGDTGATGAQGAQGEKGDVGAQGEQGADGANQSNGLAVAAIIIGALALLANIGLWVIFMTKKKENV